MIAEEDESEMEESGQSNFGSPDQIMALFDPPDAAQLAQLSFHAMSDTQTAQTIKVFGGVAQHSVHVLVDGGSTLNFIQTQVARTLGLQHSSSPTLRVMVGNGDELTSAQVCKEVQIEIQGHSFVVDLYILNLSGPDIVLGTPWLKMLGPVLMDYQSLTMKFQHGAKEIVLQGETGPSYNNISYHQLKKLVQQEPTTQIFSLHLLDSDDSSSISTSENLGPNFMDLLHRYAPLFDEPTSLPPSRFTDHQIPLNHNDVPVNVRPYRYPHAQKQEIESQVRKLLENGWIQPSNSPFSSLVLLLKKKDGTWRMCVDYRALNAITERDRFPLPTIDELWMNLDPREFFPSWTSRQDFIKSASSLMTVPRRYFEPMMAIMSTKSCRSAFATHQQPFKQP